MRLSSAALFALATLSSVHALAQDEVTRFPSARARDLSAASIRARSSCRGGADHLYSFGIVALSLPIDFDRFTTKEPARVPSTTSPASS